MNEWLDGINADELEYFASPLTLLNSGSEEDTEQAASFLYREGPSHPRASMKRTLSYKSADPSREPKRLPKKYWEAVKQEIAILICTDHKKYRELKKSLNAAKNKGTNALVAIVAAGIASQFGIAAGAIAGFCAIAINSVIKIGKEAYCSLQTL
ncbi:hypothetical protein [Thiomicrorhabdus heinhorstiae]|uniref:Uncharacterized protein n=1 Tax=Thiomicrorhabdus heinhorstiae TaxID=2748010 RepID=A0ABS0BW09_9GAMM|nr:hypothetical protein [Thiomicrorhabdus heinhorstiae]MBF6058005.1 hypothetical protein [Thiomicrorhabdus heinhorstiae]